MTSSNLPTRFQILKNDFLAIFLSFGVYPQNSTVSIKKNIEPNKIWGISKLVVQILSV